MPSEDHDWSNPAERAQFAEMWMAGETTAVIAAAFRVSVNAVVGIRRRLRLPARPSPLGQSLPTVLHIDFGFVHAGRHAGEAWEELSEKVNHPRDALRKWYDAQCARHGVGPVRLRKKGLRPVTLVQRKTRPEPVFADIHKARVERLSWAAIAARVVGFTESGLSKWYARECLMRDIKPVVVSQYTLRHSEFSFFKNAPVEATPLPAPISGGVLYEFMPRGCCNWMLNDARPWRACGAPAGRVYCGEHTRQASARLCTRVVMVGEVAA